MLHLKLLCSTPATDSEEEEAAALQTQRETHLHSQVLHLKSPKGPGESLNSAFSLAPNTDPQSCCHVLMRKEEQKTLKSVVGTALSSKGNPALPIGLYTLVILFSETMARFIVSQHVHWPIHNTCFGTVRLFTQ